jgi:DNA-binding transcriptional ArsR family regulator
MAKAIAPRDTEEAAEMAKMLADPARLKILSVVVFDGPVSVRQVCEAVNLPQPTVSHHLGLLRRSKIVEGKRHGKQVIYSVHGGLSKSGGMHTLKAMVAKLTR